LDLPAEGPAPFRGKGERRDPAALVGKIAVTDTPLDPRGAIAIDGEVHQAESEGGRVEAGRGVRVTRIKGRKIMARRV